MPMPVPMLYIYIYIRIPKRKKGCVKLCSYGAKTGLTKVIPGGAAPHGRDVKRQQQPGSNNLSSMLSIFTEFQQFQHL